MIKKLFYIIFGFFYSILVYITSIVLGTVTTIISPVAKWIDKRRKQKRTSQGKVAKQNLMQQLDDFDPFTEIAKNGLETTIYTHGGNDGVHRSTLATFGRIGKAYVDLGKRPIFLYIGQRMNYLTNITTFGARYVEYPVDSNADLLKLALQIKTDIDNTTENLMIHISYHNLRFDAEKLVSEYLSMILPTIANVGNHICLVIIPYKTLHVSTSNLIDTFGDEQKNFNFQCINPDFNEYVHSMQRLKDVPTSMNRILFPMYHYRMDDEKLLKNTKAAFPNIDPKYITMNFWHCHQAIYDINGHSGVYCMEEEEVVS